MEFTRRALPAAAGTAGTALLAGCNDSGGSVSDDLRVDRVDEEVPRVSFGFECDADAGAVTVAHESGGPVRRDRLFVRVDGFAERASVDTSEAGDTVDGKSGVTVADSVTVGVTSSFDFRLTWEVDDRSTASCTASYFRNDSASSSSAGGPFSARASSRSASSSSIRLRADCNFRHNTLVP